MKDVGGLATLGAVFTLFGICGALRHRRFRGRVESVPGRVVDMHEGLA
jgi:hypothetical protein